MGTVYQIQGKLKEAFEHHQQALNIDREIGNKEGEASDLCNIGIAYRYQGKLKEALNKFKESLRIFKTLGASSNIENLIEIMKDLEEE